MLSHHSSQSHVAEDCALLADFRKAKGMRVIVILGLYWDYTGFVLGLYWGYIRVYIGIMEKKMETTI